MYISFFVHTCNIYRYIYVYIHIVRAHRGSCCTRPCGCSQHLAASSFSYQPATAATATMCTYVCICISKYIYRETEMCNHTQTHTYIHKDTEHRYISTHKHTYILTAHNNKLHFTLSLALSLIAASECTNACVRACVCVCVCVCVRATANNNMRCFTLSPALFLSPSTQKTLEAHTQTHLRTHTYAHTQTLSPCLLLSLSDCRHHHASFRKYE